MPTCRICKHAFKALRFQTEHIDICTRCVNTLNESPEPASKAQARLSEMLARGMRRNAERDLESEEDWKRRKARWTLDNFDEAVAAALSDWVTSLLKSPKNSTRDFKIMRAQRRGLLRMEGFADYPGNWAEVARSIRARDHMRCTACNTMDAILDVHHIVYLSKHGTNQQHNLITLCRPCHEAEHGREFDGPEAKDPESISPMQPPPGGRPQPPAPQPAAPPATSPPAARSTPAAPPPINPHIDLLCPRCATVLTLPAHQAVTGQKLRCKKCALVFTYGITRSELFHGGLPATSPPASPPATVANSSTNPAQPVAPHADARKAHTSGLLVLGVLMGFILLALIAASHLTSTG